MSRFFETVSRIFGKLTGFYSYGYRENEPGVYINEAVASNFGLHSGMMSERALNDFVMCSTGGVNGRRMRHGEGLLFKKANGKFVTVTYDPMKKDHRGYVQEHRVPALDAYKRLVDLPSCVRIEANAEYRAGGSFLAVSVTPHEYRGEAFDYACIAEFFDLLRRELKKPAVHWIGERDYIIMIGADELSSFAELCDKPVTVDGEAVALSVVRAVLPPRETADDAMAKLEYCALRLRAGIVGGEYLFDRADYEKYLARPKLHELLGSLDHCELSFLPAVSVKTGRVEYFRVTPKSGELTENCISAGMTEELEKMLIERLTEGLRNGDLSQVDYCVAISSEKTDTAALAALCAAAQGKIYAELNTRVKRYESSLAERANEISSVGAIPVIAAPEAEPWSLDGLRRCGFAAIRADRTSATLKSTANICRMFGLNCTVIGVDTEGEFIRLRRLGVDICGGRVISEPVELPQKMLYAVPQIIVDEEPSPEPESEPEKEPLDISRLASELICEAFAEEIGELTAPRDKIVLQPTDKLERLEPLGESELEPLEYEEGIGAKKKRKPAATEKAQKKRQQKEIKAGELKKEKLEKK